jgi:hypothetical protein
MAKKKNRYAGLTNDQIIAKAEGDVQFGPQLSQIRDLYTEAAKQKLSDIGSAKQTAASTIAFANQNRPTVKTVYARGASQADKTAADVNAAFGKLGANNPYSAEIAAEQGGMRNRIEEARIGALQNLTDAAVGAKAGRGLAINQARAAYRESKSTLDQKLSDLLGQRGSYIAGRLATLGNQAADRANKVKVAKIGAGAGMNKPITSGAFAGMTPADVNKLSDAQRQAKIDAYNKGKGGGSDGRAKLPERTKFSDAVNKAMTYAQHGFDQGFTRQQVATTLRQGSPIPKGGGQATPSFGALVVTAANDMIYDGHISRQTAKLLHQNGIKVGDIQNAMAASDFQAHGLREPHKQAEWQAKMRARQAHLGGGDWIAQMRAALGAG